MCLARSRNEKKDKNVEMLVGKPQWGGGDPLKLQAYMGGGYWNETRRNRESMKEMCICNVISVILCLCSS